MRRVNCTQGCTVMVFDSWIVYEETVIDSQKIWEETRRKNAMWTDNKTFHYAENLIRLSMANITLTYILIVCSIFLETIRSNKRVQFLVATQYIFV